MSKNGRIIVIEGLDGSGKATQSEILLGRLAASGEKVVKASFPDYESRSSEPVKMYLAGEIGSAGGVNAYAASSFYAADRYISFKNKWEKSYLDGYTIIMDRYTTSNAVHQMAKLPEGEWEGYLLWLWDFEFARMKLPKPDTVVYLDMSPEVSRKLIMKRYGGDASRADIHERDIEYQLACRRAALFSAERFGWEIIECYRGGELKSIEEISAMIAEKISL